MPPHGFLRSHEISALYGIDRTLGVADTPSRRLINQAHQRFLTGTEIVFVMLVRSAAKPNEALKADSHGMITGGVYIGNSDTLFEQATELSRRLISLRSPRYIPALCTCRRKSTGHFG